MHFKKEGGPSAGSSFEQISMQRLTGVPSPISGGTGWVGSQWAGIWKGWGLPFDLARVQALHAGFDQRTALWGKLWEKMNKGPEEPLFT